MNVPRNAKPRRGEPGQRHQKLATIEYQLVTFLSNVTGSIFWFFEQRKWKLADQLEEQELAR